MEAAAFMGVGPARTGQTGPESRLSNGDTVTKTVLVLHPPLLCFLQARVSLMPFSDCNPKHALALTSAHALRCFCKQKWL